MKTSSTPPETAGKASEASIQAKCFQWHWNNFPGERRQLFMVYNNPKNAAHGAVLKAMGMVAGVADLCYLTSAGRVVFLECKKPGETQSSEQKLFEAQVLSAGHSYEVFTSLTEFQDVITRHQQ